MGHTAVEWLEKEFIKLENTVGVYGIMYELIEKAKEIEKQERMYSEEEVIDLLQEMNDWPTICEGRSDIEEWFKQFKKK